MISRAIAVLGEPASGKTMLTESLLPHLGLGIAWKWRLLEGSAYRGPRVQVLGVYDGEPWGGPDRLSMAVQKDAILWLHQERNGGVRYIGPTPGEHEWALYLEGDRLGCRSFLETLLGAGVELRVAVLKCEPRTLEARQAVRGNRQAGPWLRGRRTKIAGIVGALNGRAPVTWLVNDTLVDQLRNCARLLEWLGVTRPGG